uniref:Response regulatory domain-containing protein n=1 Tax=Ananas comosus var. bracteatus TaxID=296719 RepID=A0A6V7PX11_ANACO|nr:unnamed protein product [Ananas comosus var. bracteatus]
MPALPSPEDMTALPRRRPHANLLHHHPLRAAAATTLVQQMASGCAASPAASVAVDIMNKALPDHIHVLVVDGDSTSLKALESSLLAHNYKVTTCSEGTEALSMLRKGEVKFHLVLSDTYLPDMIGCKFLNCVTSETYLPVIMMSAEPDEEAEAHAAFIHMCFGARGHRRKPLPETVIQDLWQFVMRARLEQMMGPAEWTEMAESYDNLTSSVNIALVGKYTSLTDSYLSVVKVLLLSVVICPSACLCGCSMRLSIQWIAASDLEDESARTSSSCILIPGGFGDRIVPGMILAAKYARE